MSTINIPVISPRELANLAIQGKPIALIDVRTPAEFRDFHVAFARSAPLDQIDPAAIMSAWTDSSIPLYVVCRSGGRTQKACELFHAAGYTNVVNVEGGTLACERDGLPIVRGRKTISVERQARILSGFLAPLGVLLGYFVHPAWFALCAVAIIERVASAILGRSPWCPLLSKLPWNRCSDCAIADVCCH